MFVDAGSSNVLEEYSETWPQPLGDLLSGMRANILNYSLSKFWTLIDD